MTYYRYFKSEYSNKVDNFRIEILGTDSTFVEENISAIATLSTKDVDNNLSPIRGKQLEIEIDANIDKPFDLFLDFGEKDFKVLFFRNEILIFQGFINAEGVTQSYTSINWRAKLIAVDNLGALKNNEFQYNNELPSEFVFMDKCLKQTGLDLPIAFFDDINMEMYQNNVKVEYGATLDDGVNERIIEPEVFINKNDTFQDCETILKDILQKYNAILIQENIRYYDKSNEEFDNQLCWLFLRIPLLKVPYSDSFRPYKIKYINNYFNSQTYKDIFKNQDLITPNSITIGTFSTPFNLLGTDGSTFLGTPNVIHKNKNQLLRQTRALQNFRFEHKWIKLPDLLYYDYFRFIILDTFYSQNDYIREVNDLLELDSTVNTSPAVFKVANNLSECVQLQEEAQTIELNGSVTMVNNTPFIPITANNKYIKFAIYQIIESGDNAGVYIARPFDENENPVFDFDDIATIEWELLSTDINDAFTEPTSDDDYLYLFYTRDNFNFSLDLDFNIVLPPTLFQGGKVNLFFQQFSNKEPFLTQDKKYTLTLNELNLRVIPPEKYGEGEFHDAKNLQDVSSKVDDPIEVINADENTNFFLNGLKRIVNNELVNYDYWTSYFNLQQDMQNLLELTSIERVKLFSKSQNIFSGDIHGYVPFYTRLANTAYGNAFTMAFTKWVYDTNENTISAELMENDIKNPSVDYEKTFIFEDEDKKLID